MRKIIYVPLVLVLFAACNKYEEGPDFALQSKTERISNNWKVNNVLENGEEATLAFCSTYPAYQLNIGADKKFTSTYKTQPDGMHVETGTWKFNNDKTHIILTNSDGKEFDYTIIRLDKNDLRLKCTLENGCERKIHFMPKGDS